VEVPCASASGHILYILQSKEEIPMLDLDKTNFEAEVLKAEGYVFVDFYGDGCVPCQALMPKVHEFADTYGDKLKFTSLNTTKARRLAIAQKVLGLPVMAIYKDGEKVEELVKDDCTPETIEAMIKKYI
jgi:thioredoxin 1